MDVDAPENDEEADRRLAERWRFDNDDGPAYGPGGSEEQDRVLVDDHSVGYVFILRVGSLSNKIILAI